MFKKTSLFSRDGFPKSGLWIDILVCLIFFHSLLQGLCNGCRRSRSSIEISSSRWCLRVIVQISLSKSGCTCSASCSGKGSSLEKDRVAGAGSGCGRIGVKSTVAPACTSANRESQTCKEISCFQSDHLPLNDLIWISARRWGEDLAIFACAGTS